MKLSHQTRTQRTEHNAIYNNFSFDLYSRISMAELTAATKNFSPDLIIGAGRYSLVYKGRVSNGIVVAVKKLKSNEFQGLREFRVEMETLGKLHHRNILPLVGYCESDYRLLVFKFMERGNLDQWLHDTSSVGNEKFSYWWFPLSWETRIRIVRGVANGLSYLHGLKKPIVHRNISASNILLDYKFEAQIAHFELARRIQSSCSDSNISTEVAGTMGYLPPEYEGYSVATVKGDVYSFGILMMEIATGHQPDSEWQMNGKMIGIADWAIEMVVQNSQMQMVDPNIARKGLMEASVVKYFRIACMCITESPRKRPVMTKIVHLLNQILL
ncbi:Receptor-like kinase [Quillaja saponaria]|uniref:Receptor-like kinase n=1 Tax=Quillaja saponaria TaxID=32244 RepID=A0AAD7L0B7_QUISA|nr:Receptor-like kinase [Quillaja saponaria]